MYTCVRTRTKSLAHETCFGLLNQVLKIKKKNGKKHQPLCKRIYREEASGGGCAFRSAGSAAPQPASPAPRPAFFPRPWQASTPTAWRQEPWDAGLLADPAPSRPAFPHPSLDSQTETGQSQMARKSKMLRPSRVPAIASPGHRKPRPELRARRGTLAPDLPSPPVTEAWSCRGFAVLRAGRAPFYTAQALPKATRWPEVGLS